MSHAIPPVENTQHLSLQGNANYKELGMNVKIRVGTRRMGFAWEPPVRPSLTVAIFHLCSRVRTHAHCVVQSGFLSSANS